MDLVAYLRLWASNRLFFIWLFPSTDALFQAPLVLVAAWAPSNLLLLLTHLSAALSTAWRLPFVLTSDMWSSVTDATVAAFALRSLIVRCPKGGLASAAPTVRWQLAIFCAS